jgi:predicted ATPase
MLRSEPSLSLIGIEEPENGVYPGRLRALLSFLQETAPPPQILLTSHSPVVLAALRAAPERLRFIDLVRRDGQLVTRARTVAPTADRNRGRFTISLREIDALLEAADSEAAE